MDHVHTEVLDVARNVEHGLLEDMETIFKPAAGRAPDPDVLRNHASQAIADIAKKFQKDPVTVRVIKRN